MLLSHSERKTVAVGPRNDRERYDMDDFAFMQENTRTLLGMIQPPVEREIIWAGGTDATDSPAPIPRSLLPNDRFTHRRNRPPIGRQNVLTGAMATTKVVRSFECTSVREVSDC